MTKLPDGFSAMQMTVSPDGRFSYIAAMGFSPNSNSISGSVLYKVETDSGSILASASFPGVDPSLAITAITFDSTNNRVLVALSSHMFIFDAGDLRLVNSDYVWHRNLYSMVSDPVSGRVFGLVGPSSSTGGRIVLINPQDGSLMGDAAYSGAGLLPLGPSGYRTPRLAVSPDGARVYALPNDLSELMVIDSQTMSFVHRRDIGEVGGSLALSPTIGTVFVTDPTARALRRFSMSDLTELGSSPLGGRCPGSLALDTMGERAVIGHPCGGTPLQLFDPQNAEPLSTPFNNMNNGMSLWMRADGRRMLALSSFGTSLGTYDIQTREERRASQRATLPLPSAPRDVRVSLAGTTAMVSWVPPKNAKRSKVARYLLRGSPGSLSCTTKSSRTRCRVTGLEIGRTYAFAVQAENAVGKGPSAVSAYSYVPVGRPPERPGPERDPKPPQEIS